MFNNYIFDSSSYEQYLWSRKICENNNIFYSEQEVSKEEKVIKLLKGGFEEQHGFSVDDFIKISNDILENNPEVLI